MQLLYIVESNLNSEKAITRTEKLMGEQNDEN
jgi:hypothetical protein